jgi:peptidoglycan/LPS O-acetylase OafA/YrhL
MARPGPGSGAVRYTNIQFLRVAAALGVVLFHLGCHAPALVGLDPAAFRHPLLAGFPVPLFFAVSGFVLTHALQTAPPGRFLLARFLRLYPGYWLALAGVVLLMWLRVYTEQHRWAIHSTGVSTVTLWPAGAGRVLYFIGVEWSLVYEVFLSTILAAFGLFGRRAVPALAGVWLAALAVKMAVRPGYGFDTFPHWSRIALSGHAVPFLLGVVAYQLRGAGRRWGWAVGPAVVGLLYLNCTRPLDPERGWAVWGLAAAGLVWLAVALPQSSGENRLARLGDCTYGLFLFHVPLMLAVFYPAARLGWGGRWEVVWLAGAVAVAGGLLFGRVEAAVHARLRPLARLDWGGVGRRLGRQLAVAGRPRMTAGR